MSNIDNTKLLDMKKYVSEKLDEVTKTMKNPYLIGGNFAFTSSALISGTYCLLLDTSVFIGTVTLPIYTYAILRLSRTINLEPTEKRIREVYDKIDKKN